jgi:hypothetical protein
MYMSFCPLSSNHSCSHACHMGFNFSVLVSTSTPPTFYRFVLQFHRNCADVCSLPLSQALHCHICSCHLMCFILHILSNAYSIMSHSSDNARALMFHRNVWLESNFLYKQHVHFVTAILPGLATWDMHMLLQ